MQESETIHELGKKYSLHPTQISTWKKRFLSNAPSVFEKGIEKHDDEKEKTELFKKVLIITGRYTQTK